MLNEIIRTKNNTKLTSNDFKIYYTWKNIKLMIYVTLSIFELFIKKRKIIWNEK